HRLRHEDHRVTEAAPGAPVDLPPDDLLAEIEALAVELAREGGDHATAALEREIVVEYKDERQAKRGRTPADVVSEIDHAVEAAIRERVGARFPDHAIIGEEVEVHPAPETDFVWAVDPVDGTTNFVNGFPLFAVSVAVLYRGVPVVGAIWCATSHALRPGVYHARRGGVLAFEGEPVAGGNRASAGVRRRLAAAPGGSTPATPKWDNRVTGSAALECAYVAAGIFTSAYFGGLRLWDLAA